MASTTFVCCLVLALPALILTAEEGRSFNRNPERRFSSGPESGYYADQQMLEARQQEYNTYYFTTASPLGGHHPRQDVGYANQYGLNNEQVVPAQNPYYTYWLHVNEKQSTGASEKQSYGGGSPGYGGGGYNSGYYNTKTKSKGDDDDQDDFLWNLFFGKKDHLTDLVASFLGHKGKGKGSGRPSSGYGAPAASYGGGSGYKQPDESKELIFKKVKIVAWAGTVLLICLGAGIVAAPLLIGKGRRSLDWIQTSLPDADRVAQLADTVMKAIQNYQLAHQ